MLITVFGTIGFSEMSRGGGGAVTQSSLPPPPPLWKKLKALSKWSWTTAPAAYLRKHSTLQAVFSLFISKTPMLGLYMDTDGKRFFELCFPPKDASKSS